ncbi:nickel pincer cofactor biosynthesis protein LarC [candidate division KSB1 bacterium]|nr:nickel pincer cofactor biosynthesis protein LarC [candidate division KSB1 bacterium]
MPLAYFDCLAGASGDMILGALVDAGVPIEYLQECAAALQLPGLQLTAMKVQRCGVSATQVEVHTIPEHKHRHLYHIKDIIHKAHLPESVRDHALRIFQRLAEAEAKVHQTTPEKIHFHEVGAVDAIADVVCSAAGLHYLNVAQILVSTFPLGGGMVKCEHGLIPVPAPATVELIRNFPSRLGPIDFELLTPTGAAILTTLGRPYDQSTFKMLNVGSGAGSVDLANLPNILRVYVGEKESAATADVITVLETNIDDMSPEIYPFVVERLLDEGALDAFLTPILMKKGRPAFTLTVLCAAEKVEDLLGVIYSETSTLGVRLHTLPRRKLRRRQEKRMTSLGEVAVKIVEWNDKQTALPEFEECKRLALAQGLPLREVYDILRREFER